MRDNFLMKTADNKSRRRFVTVPVCFAGKFPGA
jgi:hypothetical protein